MNDLVEFLLARIAEEETLASAATPGPWFPHLTTHGDPSVVTDPVRPAFTTVATSSCAPSDYGRANNEHIAYWAPSRVLASCTTGRSIVTEARKYQPGQRGYGMAQSAMKSLAGTYNAHPDYQQGWAS